MASAKLNALESNIGRFLNAAKSATVLNFNVTTAGII